MDTVPTILTGTYDPRLVVVSILIAVLAAGAALDLAGRVTWARDTARFWWLTGGAVAMGVGIWSMHYIGMLAFHLPVWVLYDWPTVLLSLLAAVGASWVALFVVSRETMTVPQAIVGSLFMGGGIAAMHYIGMEAMRLPAMCQYVTELVELSIFLAIVVAFAALQMSYAFRGGTGWSWYKVATAATMGAAIPIMHYVAMAAVTFVEMPPEKVDLTHAVGISNLGIIGIAAVTLIVLGLVFLSATVDRKFSSQSVAFQDSEHQFRILVESAREQGRIAAEAGNHAKTEFLANISHELRTPMNAVIGMSELLLDTPLDSMQRNYAEDIRANGNALLTLINDILDFSKVEAGQLELEHLDVDLRDTFEDVARLASIQAHAKGLEVTLQIDPLLPTMVKADAGRVRQILLNLAGNAVKFTRQGEVALQIKVLETTERGTHVRCEVRDTGTGIAAERLKDLFKPFTQVDPAATRGMGGTGLGLAIVRRLAELMGGETGVESVRGAGSTFWFTAWFGPATQVPYALPAPPAVLKGQRVLMVDDNGTNRKVLMGQLLLTGVDPVSAGSAGEALMLMRHAAAVGRPFDAVLLDQQMPDCDGAELGRIIFDDDTLDSTRLILLTSSGQRGEGQLFADIGFAAYLLKPVAQRDLTDCLMLALASEADTWRTHSQPMITRHGLRAQRPARRG
jgi:two-component system sensor histidine kinase/response regulator